MIQTFQDKPRARFSDQILRGLSNATSEAATQIPRFIGERMQNQERKEQQAAGNKQFQDMFGVNLEGYSPDERKIFIQEMLKNQGKQQQDTKKIAPLRAGLQTVQRMRDLGKQGGLGFGSSIWQQSPQSRQNRAEYERLGKSLISLASTITIRNQREFDTLAEGLYDPTINDAKREGILNAMDRIIRTSLEEHGGEANAGNQESDTIEVSHNGETYDLPAHLVPAFKQKHGIR